MAKFSLKIDSDLILIIFFIIFVLVVTT